MLCALSAVSELLEHSTLMMYAELVIYWIRGFNRHYWPLYGAVNFNAWTTSILRQSDIWAAEG